MAERAETEGVRMLEDFVCEAIHDPGIPQSDPRKQGANEGTRVVEEFVFGEEGGGKEEARPTEKSGNLSERKCQDRNRSRDVRKVPLSQLEGDPNGTLRECADSGLPLVIELPDHRLVVLQPLQLAEDDDVVRGLLESNAEFLALVAKSKASARKPFLPETGA